ncbi:Ig-like domain-containing protein [Sinomonas mesophila]|nr:Ig-like domain-containing protein [Sinomonas mesophila]
MTAMVKDAFGNPTPGITVCFMVTRSVNTTDSVTTDPSGEATF